MNNKLILLSAVLFAVALSAPAVLADQHTNATNDTVNDTPQSLITESEAQTAAEAELPDGIWALEEVELDDDVYEFEFILENDAGEAEISVNAVTGSIISVEIERENEEEREERDTDEEQETEEEREERGDANASTLEEAREQITELREEIRELRSTIAELRRNNNATSERELPDQASERAQEARERRGPPETLPRGQGAVEVEVDGNETEVEVEAERRGPSQQARENINGTPGQNSSRPGFVTRMLQRMFG